MTVKVGRSKIGKSMCKFGNVQMCKCMGVIQQETISDLIMS